MRYKVEPSKGNPGWWVVTDVENMIVVKFKEKEFNETQKVTMLNDAEGKDVSFFARIMGDMGKYLFENYKDIVI